VQAIVSDKHERRRGPVIAIVKISSRQRGLGTALLALSVCAAVAVPLAQARARHSDAWAREHFATAERMREALNGRNPSDRSRRDYQRVLNAYRNVYLGAPSSSKADPSVVAVAETLVEMGRRFEDDKILHGAIEQYKFLRREYPGSKYRTDGLFTIGEIYKDDLNDPAAARATFQDFLRDYPRNRLAEDASQAIAELNKEEAAQAAEARKVEAKNRTSKSGRSNLALNGVIKSADDAADSQDVRPASGKEQASSLAVSGRLPRVTAIRHWSTPDYSRVAIDLEGGVKFSSKRIASPSRIFFDLRDTKLASTLVGKTFDVDDGFLKRVRVAQYAPGRTRVVLEVDSLSDYDAFLLPNPYRLIIDIHGKKGRSRQTDQSEATLTDGNSASSVKVASSDSATGATADETSLEKTDVVPAPAGLTKTAKLDEQPLSIADNKLASSTGHSYLVKNPKTGVIKKVVDADDDDTDDSAAAAVHSRDSKSSGTLRGELGGDLASSRHKSNARTLTSNPSRAATDFDIREARPTSSGDRSLIRALGLKIGKIVIDCGHGGHDTGTIGPDGLKEKDLVLEVGRRLGKLLETRLGAEVIYTRKDDTFIPLETRTAIANQARADLFVSIHANSSHDPNARGVETYYLNFTSSPEALEVAARENAVSEQSIYELQDLVKKIALKEKIEESREFAWDVQQSLHNGLAAKSPAIRDRGVKKAPFIVLIGANMPSILAEISFVSNPADERHLATSEYRERIAESLYRGIAKYVNGLSGVKVAGKMDKGAAQ
jgi:N-acetylmuramoyl-L-alanine amidase